MSRTKKYKNYNRDQLSGESQQVLAIIFKTTDYVFFFLELRDFEQIIKQSGSVFLSATKLCGAKCSQRSLLLLTFFFFFLSHYSLAWV